MFVLGNALNAIALLIEWASQLYIFVLIGHVICSWVNADRFNPIVRFIETVSEPVLSQIRRFVPPIGGLDFSVLVAILIIEFGVKRFLVRSLLDIAHNFR
jgi:YggT family protein